MRTLGETASQPLVFPPETSAMIAACRGCCRNFVMEAAFMGLTLPQGPKIQ